MKIKLSLLVSIAISVVILGCVTKNPAYTTGNTNAPQYIIDPRLNTASNAVAGAAGVAAPVNPYAGLTDWGIKLVFGLAGAISAGVLTAKNKNAVIDTLAAGVVKQGPTVAQAVLDHASVHPTFTAVADALNSNTGVNQSPTGAPKPTA